MWTIESIGSEQSGREGKEVRKEMKDSGVEENCGGIVGT